MPSPLRALKRRPDAAASSPLSIVSPARRAHRRKLTSAESRLEGLPEDFGADAYETLRTQAEGAEPTKIEERLTAQKRQLEAVFVKEREKREERVEVSTGQPAEEAGEAVTAGAQKIVGDKP